MGLVCLPANYYAGGMKRFHTALRRHRRCQHHEPRVDFLEPGKHTPGLRKQPVIRIMKRCNQGYDSALRSSVIAAVIPSRCPKMAEPATMFVTPASTTSLTFAAEMPPSTCKWT